MSDNKTAIVLGATGLVGKSLVNLLIKDDTFSRILIFVRRDANFNHPKVEQLIIDFNDYESYKSFVMGDIVYSCLGTTIKQAGSKEAQYKVDYQYQFEFAKAAADNEVNNYCLVSSTSANSDSRIFYSRIKGELEDAVEKLAFKKIDFIRPSLLLGDREQGRTGEIVGEKVLNIITKILPFLKKYRGIKDSEVALSMLNAYSTKNSKRVNIYELEEVFQLAGID